MADDRVEDLLEFCREVSETEHVEYVWVDGEYKGAVVRFKNPLHPDLKEVFHPYVPLTFSGVLIDTETMEPVMAGDEAAETRARANPVGDFAMPKVTREYFIRHGWPVPGEEPTKPH